MISRAFGKQQHSAKPLCCQAIGKAAVWREAYTNAVPWVSFVPFVPSKALQAKKKAVSPSAKPSPKGPQGGGIPRATRVREADALAGVRQQKKSRRRPTLARASPALPSAMGPLTSVFGMGTGVTTPLWSPAKKPFSWELKRITTLLRCDLISL